MRNVLIKTAAAAFLAMAFSTSAWATIIPVEEAVEAVALRVRLGNDLTGTVAGRSCDSCELKEFPVTSATQAFENNERVDLRRLRDRYGKPATIIYNIRSGEATRILWIR